MGCGLTKTAAGDLSSDQQYKSPKGRRGYASDNSSNDEDGDLAMSGEMTRSSSSVGSGRSLTTVRSTRGRIASSSFTMPYLPGIGVLTTSAPASPHTAASSGRSGEETNVFSIGDVSIDPDDVVKMRRERLSRRHSTSGSGSSNSSFSGSFNKTPTSALAPGSGLPARPMRYHDLVVTDKDLEDAFGINLNDDDAAQRHGAWARGAASCSIGSLSRRVKATTIVPGSHLFITCSTDSADAIVRDFMSKEEVRRFPSHQQIAAAPRDDAAIERIAAIVVDAAGERFACVSADGSCLVREVDSDSSNDGAAQLLCIEDDDGVTGLPSVACFVGRTMLLVGDNAGGLRLWDLKDETGTSTILHEPPKGRSRAGVTAVAATPDADMALSAGQDGLVFLFDPRDGIAPHTTFRGHQGRNIKFAAFATVEIGVSICDFEVLLWKTSNGTLLYATPLPSGASSMFNHSLSCFRSPEPSGSQRGGSPPPLPLPPSAAHLPPTPSVVATKADGPHCIAAGRRMVFGPTAAPPKNRMVSSACIVSSNDHRVIMAIADTDGNVFIRPLGFRPGCACVDCTGPSLHFRAPICAMSSTGQGSVVAGDCFGNLYRITVSVA